ncbi:MAG TPA: flippase activity-associated protein Agl23, partial [Blastocatellia bacterium]|nr:flippase activity-associated protein Agl23 [Blastocatellia bacterium]
ALSGVATVWLALCLRRHVGAFGALAGSAFIAASPGAVYMSRYFIHESLFVFFTFAVVVSAARYLESRRTIYLMLASAATALAFATKETAIISAGVLILGFFLTPLLFDIRRVLFHQEELGARGQVGDLAPHGRKTLVQNLRRRRAEITRETVKWLIAVGLFFFVLELFYSSFFSNDKWLDDVLESFRNWARTGRSVHQHSWYTYIAWLAREEFFVLIPGIVGAGLILWRATDRFVVFTLVWLCGLLCAYSVIPYKTPWLTLNFIIPLAIIGGFALDTIRKRAKNNKQRALVAGILCVIISASLYRMIRLNFFEYDDSNHPHVYAHTHRDFLSLTNEVAKIASDSGAGYDTTILIASSEYWPLPWYLRDYNRVIYLDQVRRAKEKIVIGSQDQEDNLRAALGGRYERVGSYVLRPGFNLMLYALRDGDELRPGETGTK